MAGPGPGWALKKNGWAWARARPGPGPLKKNATYGAYIHPASTTHTANEMINE